MKICGEAAMKALGARLVTGQNQTGVVTLNGDLGTGKTTLVRGVLEACGITSGVRSPTYTLVEFYPLETFTIAHFDLYRLADAEELEYLGYRDYLQPDTWCFIEWPERAAGYLDQVDLQIDLEYQGDCRQIGLQAHSDFGEELRKRLLSQG